MSFEDYPQMLKENPNMDPHPDFITSDSEHRDFICTTQESSISHTKVVNQEIELIRQQSSIKPAVKTYAIGPVKISS